VTAPAFPGRRRSGNVGWAIVGAGWLVLILAAALLFLQQNGSVLPGALGALGVICVITGAYLLCRQIWVILPLGFPFALGLTFFGMFITSGDLELVAKGKHTTCEVMEVRPYTHTRTTTDGNGRRTSVTETDYWETVKCPIGTYTISSSQPDPVGAKLEMVYVPGKAPQVAGSAELGVGLGMMSIGGLSTLVISLGAVYSRRRRAAVMANLGQVPPMRPYPTASPPGAWSQGGPAAAPPAPPGVAQGWYLPGPPPAPGQEVPPEVGAANMEAFFAYEAARQGRPVSFREQAAVRLLPWVARRSQRGQAAPPPQGAPPPAPYPAAPPPDQGWSGPTPGQVPPGPPSGPAAPPYEQR
jgi:hypothetical protein